MLLSMPKESMRSHDRQALQKFLKLTVVIDSFSEVVYLLKIPILLLDQGSRANSFKSNTTRSESALLVDSVYIRQASSNILPNNKLQPDPLHTLILTSKIIWCKSFGIILPKWVDSSSLLVSERVNLGHC